MIHWEGREHSAHLHENCWCNHISGSAARAQSDWQMNPAGENKRPACATDTPLYTVCVWERERSVHLYKPALHHLIRALSLGACGGPEVVGGDTAGYRWHLICCGISSLTLHTRHMMVITQHCQMRNIHRAKINLSYYTLNTSRFDQMLYLVNTCP